MSQKQLNPAQKQAVEYTQGPLLIVAGAGTGKTTVITEKIIYLLEAKKVKPENILALTFTEKAVKEMEERVEAKLGLGMYDMPISTFHAFCQEVLENYGLEIGIPNEFKLLTDTDAWLLAREHIYEFDLDYYRPLGNPTRHIHEILRHFSKCKDELITPAEYLEYAEKVKLDNDDVHIEERNKLIETAGAYHKYNQLLLDNNALDFGDLIFFTVKLLQERPSVRKKLQERFPYILVDEFQDVNWAQYVLTRLLSAGGQLTVVGDDDQSIYAFRGASVSNILRFKEDFKNAQDIILNENYRSKQEILDIAYKSIQNNNPDRLEVKLGVDKKLKAITNQTSMSSVELRKQSSRNESVVKHLHATTLDEEVKSVVNEIIHLKQSVKSVIWDDFAILVRANHHAEPFIRGLQNAGIPYEFLAAVGLFKQPIVMDAINFFKVLDYHHDSAALYRVLRMSCLQFSENDIQKITSIAKKKTLSYYEVIKRGAEFQLSSKGQEIISRVLQLIQQSVQKARTEKPSKILHHFFEASGCSKYLIQKEAEGDQTVIQQVYQLTQFFELLTRYEEVTLDAHIKGFLEQYNYILESGDEGRLYQSVDTPDSVNIMTIHAAKGLEFKYVFIVNLVEDRFPTRRRGEGIELTDDLIKEKLPEGDYHLQEERRLFYVGITRAKERLYFTSAKNYGGVREKKLSRFLIELEFSPQESSLKRGQGEVPKKSTQTNTNTTTQKHNNNTAIWQHNYVTVQPSSPDSKSTTDNIYSLPKSFSFSQLQTYEVCPYRYKLAHVIKIPTKSTASFSFGTTLHSTLQKFYERIQEMNAQKQSNLFDIFQNDANKEKKAEDQISRPVKIPPLSELLQIYEINFITDWYKDKHQREDYFKKGKKILQTLYQANEGNWNVPLTLESSFKIQVGGHILKGRIDRIDKLADNTLEIVDYKTGQTKEKLTSEDKEQLLIYQIVAQTSPAYKNLGTISKLTFYYLNDNVKTSFFGEDQELEKLKNKLIDRIAKIHAGNFAATPNPMVCGNCDFRDICEYRVL